MIDFVIRRAKKRDADTIAAFNIAMALETESINLDQKKIKAGVSRVLTNPENGYYLIAEKEKLIVGCMMITYEWSDWRNGQFWWIQSVYIVPEYRRQGIFGQLYNFILNQAEKDQECVGLRLYVEQDNQAAQRTYAHLGMTETAYKMFEKETK